MRTFLLIIGIVATIGSAFFFSKAYDKYTNYYNPEGLSMLQENAYVGGDAYNYIINGTYFTGFSVLGTGSLLLGMLSIGFAHISSKVEEGKTELQTISTKIRPVKKEVDDQS